jgi:hypothetical protein
MMFIIDAKSCDEPEQGPMSLTDTVEKPLVGNWFGPADVAGWKVRILLSQLHLGYERVTLDLGKGDTHRPDFREQKAKRDCVTKAA